MVTRVTFVGGGFMKRRRRIFDAALMHVAGATTQLVGASEALGPFVNCDSGHGVSLGAPLKQLYAHPPTRARTQARAIPRGAGFFLGLGYVSPRFRCGAIELRSQYKPTFYMRVIDAEAVWQHSTAPLWRRFDRA